MPLQLFDYNNPSANKVAPTKSSASVGGGSGGLKLFDYSNPSANNTDVTPPKSPSIISRVGSAVSGLIGDASGAIGNFFERPTTLNTDFVPDKTASPADQKIAIEKNTADTQKASEGANSFGGTATNFLKDLPSSFVEHLPLGVGDIFKQVHDMESQSPEALQYETGKNIISSIPKGVENSATGVVKGLASVPLTVAGAVAGLGGKDQEIKFNVKGLGEVTNMQARIVDDVLNGQNPAEVGLGEGVNELMNGLWLYSIIKAPFVSRPTTIAETTPEQTANMMANKGTVIGETPEGAKVKSFREYQQPTVSTPVVTEVNPALLERLKGEGVDMSKYNPKQPTVFRFKMDPTGQISGEVVQIKPSAFDALKGKFTEAEVAKLPDTAFEEPMYSKTVNGTDLEEAAKNAEVTPVDKTTQSTPTSNIESPHAQAYSASLGSLSTAKPSEVRDSLSNLENQLSVNREATKPKDETALIGKINATRDVFNAYNDANKKTLLSVSGGTNQPLATVEIVPYEDGKYGISTNANVAGSGFGNGFDTNTLYSSSKEALAAGKAEIQKWIDGEKINATPTALAQLKKIETQLTTSKSVEKPVKITPEAKIKPLAKSDIQEPASKEIPKAVQAKAESDWHNNYADKYGEMADKELSLRQKIKSVPKSEAANLQKELTKITTTMGAMEDKWLGQWSEKTPTKNVLPSTKSKRIGMMDYHPSYTPHMNELIKEAQDNGDLFPSSKMTKQEQAILDAAWKSGMKNVIDEKSKIEPVSTKKPQKEDKTTEKTPIFKKPTTTLEKQPEPKSTNRKETQGGFANPTKAIEDIKNVADKLKTHFEETNKAVKFAKNLDDTLFKTQKNAEADTIDKIKLVKDVKNLLTPAEWENVYHYREAKAAGVELPTLTEKEKTANDEIITPINKQNAQMAAKLKDYNIPLSEDSLNPRQVKGRGSMLDRAVAQKDRLFSSGGGGKKSVLKQSAPELKKRTMRAITDENGNRTVVAIKGGRVTGFKNGIAKDLGALKKPKIPTQTEYTDANVRDTLEKLAKDLGIKHERVPFGKKDSALGRNKAGVSIQGGNTIKTRVGSPERVLLHEIGHQLDHRYDIKGLFPDTPLYNKQMRDLADMTYENNPNVKQSFKNYARKSGEKVAVMFEAYLHAPQRFEEIAPQVYDSFTKFLGRHPELKPILEIKPSMVLGKNVYKDQTVPNTFTDKNGKVYNIGEATTKEIEGNTGVTYYKNPFVNAMIANNDLTQAYRATQTLEALKTSPQFEENFMKSGEGVPPDGWKQINLDQLRGYYAEPHIADTLNAFAKDLDTHDPLAILSAINNFVTSSVFLTPVGHFINVGTSSIINRGVTGWLNPFVYPRLIRTSIQAVRDVVTQNPEYVAALRAGAPFMSNSGNAKEFKENLLSVMGQKPDIQKQVFDKAKKAVGYVNPIVWTHKLTWPANDMLLLQQILETREMKGISTEDAIKDVTKVLPDYRLPVKVRLVGKPIIRNTTAFLTYRLNTLNSYLEIGKTVITGNGSEKPMQVSTKTGKRTYGEYTNKESFKARAGAFNKIAMALALGTIVIPIINDELKKLSGNPYTHLHEPAQLAIVQNVNKLINGDIDFGAWVQTIISPAIATDEILQQFLNLDTFTGNKIRIAGTSAMDQIKASIQHAETAVTPINDINRVQSGKATKSELLMSFGGIDNPHTGAGTVKSNSLIYDLKPNLETQMKAEIFAGNKQGAKELMNKFNASLKKAYLQTYSEQNKTPSIFKMNADLKQYGVKMPGIVAMDNYKAKMKAKVK